MIEACMPSVFYVLLCITVISKFSDLLSLSICLGVFRMFPWVVLVYIFEHYGGLINYVIGYVNLSTSSVTYT